MIAIPQIIAAMIVGVFLYMLAVVLTVYDGLLSVIFQPILGAIFTGIAILFLVAVGLPIRRNDKVNRWWKAHWWIALVIGSIAFLLMCLSWMPQFRIQVIDPEVGVAVDGLNPGLAIGGWLLALFAVLHFYPPRSVFNCDSA